jgi:hypothetical protein
MFRIAHIAGMGDDPLCLPTGLALTYAVSLFAGLGRQNENLRSLLCIV